MRDLQRGRINTTSLVALAIVQSDSGCTRHGGHDTRGAQALEEIGRMPLLNLGMVVNGILDLEQSWGGLGRDQWSRLRESSDQADQRCCFEISQ